MKIVRGSGKNIRHWLPSEKFSITQTPATRGFGSNTSISTPYSDMVLNASFFGGSINTQDISVINPQTDLPCYYSSKTPNICTVNPETGETTINESLLAPGSYYSQATCIIEASNATGTKTISFDMAIAGGAAVYDKLPTLTDVTSLRYYLKQQQIAALVGVTPGAGKQRAGAYPNGMAAGLNTEIKAAGSYGGINTNNFLFDSKPGFDGLPADALSLLLNGGSFGNQGGAQWQAWISPHHFLSWRGHYISGVDGGIYYKVLGDLHTTQGGTATPNSLRECCVYYSPTAYTGTLVTLLPSNWREYMPETDIGLRRAAPTAIACWTRMFNIYQGSGINTEKRWVQPTEYLCRYDKGGIYPPTDPRRPYQKPDYNNILVTGGDSGSPVFCGIKGNLVLLGHVAEGGLICYWEDVYADDIAEITSVMNILATRNGEVNPTYVCPTIDLDGYGFPKFSGLPPVSTMYVNSGYVNSGYTTGN